jgi:hypothetical protein
MNLRSRFGRTQTLMHRHDGRQPADAVIVVTMTKAVLMAGGAAMGGQAAIAPVAADLLGKPSV